MKNFAKIDLHMHTTISDGTDTPRQLLEYVREKGLGLFSVTDHDAVKGSLQIPVYLQEGDPKFLTGVEFSCKDRDDPKKKYHILGYGYDPESRSMRNLVETGHRYRMEKLEMRLDHLKSEFGVVFPKEEVDSLYQMDNPGKPHIGNLMVKYGFAPSRNEAINNMINKLHVRGQYFTPDQAIEGILGGGGIPVLAHPSYGSGDQLIIGEEMDQRLKKLMGYGLKGVEAFYSGFNSRLQNEVLDFAEKYDLYVTAGSDYHGRNKLVVLGDTNLEEGMEYPAGLIRFLEDMEPKML